MNGTEVPGDKRRGAVGAEALAIALGNGKPR
jgi:hypothetical protein